MTRMAHKYIPTVHITPDMYQDILTHKVDLRLGQWITINYGRRGQFLGVHGGIIKGSWVMNKDTFEARTQRWCRANWHHNHKCNGTEEAVMTAPKTTKLDAVKAAVRNLLRLGRTGKPLYQWG